MKIKKILAFLLAFAMVFALCSCTEEKESEDDALFKTGDAEQVYTDAQVIKLDTDSATLNGEKVEEFDYTWNVDPTTVHSDVKNAPAEYYTGTEPETDAAVYIDHELYYFPELSTDGFKLVTYDGEQEWVYYYADGTNNDYIFATLPNLGTTVPTDMMHSAEEAANNKVLHITKAGTYILEGEWNGQIWIDLGDQDDTFTDETAKVTIILNGVNINCSVAPGIVFYSVYECDNDWEDQESWTADVDLSDAGAQVIIADSSVNTVTGQNIYRMLKTKYKDEESTDAIKVQKKVRKTDAAFYSYRSMVISGGTNGTGTLTVNSSFEGMDSELHLAINGGNITINSQDDGMNVNEDYVSVLFINGGSLTLNASLGTEGDGIDSNGFVVINGGTLTVNGVTAPDSSVDSETGITYNDGTVIIDGETQTLTKGSNMNSISSSGQGMGGQGGGQGGMVIPTDADFDLEEFKKSVSELPDDATLQDVLELLGFGGGQGGDFDPGQGGQGGEVPDLPGEGGEVPSQPGEGGEVPSQPGEGGQGGEIPGQDGTEGQTNPPEMP